MDEWIPITCRVPDDDRYVLLSFENWQIPAIGQYREDEEGSGAFYLEDSDRSLVSLGIFVNAWMELPRRYEG